MDFAMKPTMSSTAALISPAITVSVILLAGGGTAPVGGAEHDWTAVELAWREDPRAPADAPFEVDVPQGRRGTRRAQRRSANRRRMPLDDVPVDVRPESMPSALSTPGREPGPLEEAAVPRSLGVRRGPEVGGERGPIPVETTLDSPFEAPATKSDATVIAHRDHPYGDVHDARQKFDIFLPADCGGGGMPLVVWIHGDTWRDGSKADCAVCWLATEGYAVASIGYRLSDTATFPAQLDDCRAAVDEIIRTAEVWGIDRDRIALVGSGAGGHLAALAGLSGSTGPGTTAAEPVSTGSDGPNDSAPPRIAAICAVATPSHLTTLGAQYDRAGSPASLLVGGPLPEFREVAQRASPLTHVSADDPPCLVIHGTRDDTIPPEQSVRLDTALRAAGVDSTLVVLDGAGHKLPLDRTSPAGRALLEFLDRTLGPGIRAHEAAPSARPSSP
jgi:dienelactone hydrolase